MARLFDDDEEGLFDSESGDGEGSVTRIPAVPLSQEEPTEVSLFDNLLGLGGYSCYFVSLNDPPSYLLCLICFSTAKNPYQMDCCGKLYCYQCITEHKKNNNKCPHCRGSGKSFKDKRAEQEVLALKVKCTNNGKGCKWEGELRALEGHRKKDCSCEAIPCPNKCKARAMRKELNDHLFMCPKRQYNCPNCGESGQYEHIVNDHLVICPKVVVKCPHPECSYSCHRDSLKVHLCPYDVIQCKYSNIGCKEKSIRKKIQAHEQDIEYHFHLSSKLVIELQQEVKGLKKQSKFLYRSIADLKEEATQETQSYVLHCLRKIDEKALENDNKLERRLARIEKMKRSSTFRLDSFSEYKEASSEFYSEPIYSSKKGYKFTIIVYANGNSDDGKGKYISVYATLEKGENDDFLSWPFSGEVSIELLNQLEDENHFGPRSIHFSLENKNSTRVVDESEGHSGYGFPCYIAHSELGQKDGRQYLKDDTLFFRVSIHVTDYKSWLECTVGP